MTEPTWHRTEVPPLRADIDRRLRQLRRDYARAARGGWFVVSGLLGIVLGALIAWS